ncbi:hypothetical protein CYMTET_28936, partial [Cymbomonas tetramitiformis]
AVYNDTSMTIMVAAGTDVKVWNAQTGALQRWFKNLTTSELTAVSFDMTQRKFVTGDHHGRIVVWHYSNGTCLTECEGHDGEVTQIEYSYTQQHLQTIASTSWDGTINVYIDDGDNVWKVRTLQPMRRTDLVCCAIDIKANAIAAGGRDYNAYVYGIDHGTSQAILGPHYGDSVGYLHIWPSRTAHLSIQYKCLLRWSGGVYGISSLAFDEGECRLYAGNEKGVIRVWDLSATLTGNQAWQPQGSLSGEMRHMQLNDPPSRPFSPAPSKGSPRGASGVRWADTVSPKNHEADAADATRRSPDPVSVVGDLSASGSGAPGPSGAAPEEDSEGQDSPSGRVKVRARSYVELQRENIALQQNAGGQLLDRGWSTDYFKSYKVPPSRQHLCLELPATNSEFPMEEPPLLVEWLAHKEAVCSIGMVPDSTCALTASTDKTVRLWDRRTGQAIGLLHVKQKYMWDFPQEKFAKANREAYAMGLRQMALKRIKENLNLRRTDAQLRADTIQEASLKLLQAARPQATLQSPKSQIALTRAAQRSLRKKCSPQSSAAEFEKEDSQATAPSIPDSPSFTLVKQSSPRGIRRISGVEINASTPTPNRSTSPLRSRRRMSTVIDVTKLCDGMMMPELLSKNGPLARKRTIGLPDPIVPKEGRRKDDASAMIEV